MRSAMLDRSKLFALLGVGGVLSAVGPLAACGSRLATVAGPFRDLALPGPCVIDAQRRVQCWGAGKRHDVGIDRPVELQSSGELVCARPEAGPIGCWSEEVQLGVAYFNPVSLPKLGAPSQISSHGGVRCAIDGGGVACFSLRAPEPRSVAGLRGVRQVQVYVDRACALLDSGRLACWKATDADPAGASQPATEVSGLDGARQFSLGFLFGCAVLDDGGVSCWGLGNMGELGRHVAPHVEHAPARVPGLSQVVQVATSAHVACALEASGAVKCWGRNLACELGIAKRKVGDLSEQPLLVAGLEPSSKLAFESDRVCSLSKKGNLTCWGGCREDNDPKIELK